MVYQMRALESISKVVWLKCQVSIDLKEKRVAWYTSIGHGENVAERDFRLSWVRMCLSSMEPWSKCCIWITSQRGSTVPSWGNSPGKQLNSGLPLSLDSLSSMSIINVSIHNRWRCNHIRNVNRVRYRSFLLPWNLIRGNLWYSQTRRVDIQCTALHPCFNH